MNSVRTAARFRARRRSSDQFTTSLCYFFGHDSPIESPSTSTAPYLHDGSVEDLSTMVSLMADRKLGKEISDGDVDSIVSFLKALTGEVPGDYIAKPELPASGPDTPKPDR